MADSSATEWQPRLGEQFILEGKHYDLAKAKTIIKDAPRPVENKPVAMFRPMYFSAVKIDWDKAEWRIPAGRMKMKELHIVPLSKQAVEVLRQIQKLTGHRQYVFANEHNPATYMSENTMLYAVYRMDYHSRATRRRDDGHVVPSSAPPPPWGGFLPTPQRPRAAV